MDALAERSNSHDSQFAGRDARLHSIYDKYLYDPRDLTSPDPRLRELARKASKEQHAHTKAHPPRDGMSASQLRKKRQSAIGFAPGTKGGDAAAGAPAHRREDSGGGAWAGFMMGNGAVSDSDSDSDAEADRRRRPAPKQNAAESSRTMAARGANTQSEAAGAGVRGSWTSRAAAVGSRPPDSASQNPPTLKLLGLKSLKDGGSPLGHSPTTDGNFAAQQAAPRSTARTPDFEMIAGAEQRDKRRNDERALSTSDYGDEVDARHGSTIDFGRAMQRSEDDEARPSRGVNLSDDGPAPASSSKQGRPVSPRTALTRQLGLVTPMPDQHASSMASPPGGDYFGGGPPAPMSAGPSARGPPPAGLDARAPPASSSTAPPHPRTLLPAPSRDAPASQSRAPPPAQLRGPSPPQQAVRGPPGDRFGGGGPGAPVQRAMPAPPSAGMRGPQPPPQAMQRGPPPSYPNAPRGAPSPTGAPGGYDRGLAPPGAMRGPPGPPGPPGPGYGPSRGPPPPAGFSRPPPPPPAGFSDSRPPQKGSGNVFRRSMAFFSGDGPGPAPRPPNAKRQSAFRRSMAFITGRPMPQPAPAPAPRPYEDDDANAPQPRVRGFIDEKPKSRKSIFFGASGMGDEWDVSGRGERFWRRFSLAQHVAAKPDPTSAALRAKVQRRQRMVKCLSFLGLLAIIAGIAVVVVWRESKTKTTDIPGSINRAESGGVWTPVVASSKTRRDIGPYGLHAFPAPTNAPVADLYDVAMGSKRSVPFGDAAGAALARRHQHRRLAEHPPVA